MLPTPDTIKKIHQGLDSSFFLYDLDAMENHLRSLSTPGVRLWYACKANPLSRILDTVAAAGLSFDVASVGELRQVLSRKVKGENILLTGPGKSEKFLQEAFAAGVRTVVLESFSQAEQMEAHARRLGTKIRVLLRLQLDWDTETKSVLGGGKISVFGLETDSWRKFKPENFPHLEICGVHVFQWGNILKEERLDAIWKKIAEEAASLADDLRFPLEVLDLGGGLGIPYSLVDQALQFSLLQKSLEAIRQSSGAKEIWLELGRYAVGSYGVYVTEILERKTVRGKNFLICAGGAQHLVRPALVGESFPCVALRETDKQASFAVHGPLCTALDHLGDYQLPENLEKGDLLLFSQVGAYGFTESMPFFLCHELAAELVIKNASVETIRAPQDANFWLR